MCIWDFVWRDYSICVCVCVPVSDNDGVCVCESSVGTMCVSAVESARGCVVCAKFGP